MPSLLLKICGLTRAEDALNCARLGADWLGFIFHPASPRRTTPEDAAAFETGQALRVGVFVNQEPAEVRRCLTVARLDLAQLHGNQSPDFCREIGPERVVKVFWPQRRPDNLAEEMAAYDQAAAWFLLDAGAAGGGGHGRRLDLDFLASFTPPRPWLLAGGLNAAAATAAIARAGPAGLAGLDFNSGVEISPGIKDAGLVEEAIKAARTSEVLL